MATAWIPGTDQSRPLGFTTPLLRWRAVVFHVAVTEADYPSYPAGLGAHLYVRKNPPSGEWRPGDPWTWAGVVQQISLLVKGQHATYGNADTIGVETQGGVVNPQGEPWTAYQLEACARIALLLHTERNIPLQLCERSDSSGLGWHRLGCRGNYPALPSILAGYSQRPGSWQLWDVNYGRLCPGDAKIEQMPAVLARAQALAGGATSTTTTPEDDMFEASDRALLQQVAADAAAASARAQAAADRAQDATLAAITATGMALSARSAASAAVALGTRLAEAVAAGRTDAVALADTTRAELAQLQARLPRATTARYDKPVAATYAAMAADAKAQGLTYADLTNPRATAGVDLTAVQEAARAGAALGVSTLPRTGTWSLGAQ